jgi:coenzyme F420-reducing hydrogenase delta subunit
VDRQTLRWIVRAPLTGQCSESEGKTMPEPVTPNAVVNVCRNCIPAAGHLPHQWRQGGLQVLVREIPCSGKIDALYLLHALEGVTHGFCVVACPKGDCHWGEGNCRAEIRIRMIQRLLGEMGLEPERAELLQCSPEEPFSKLEQSVHQAVRRLSALGRIPVGAETVTTGDAELGVPSTECGVPAAAGVKEVASAA